MAATAASGYWSWWLSGAALATLMLLHWVLLRRTMSVSGRYTSLVGWWRQRRAGAAPDREALLAAMRQATLDAFGEATATDSAANPAQERAQPAPESTSNHLIFLGSVLVGGLLSALTRGDHGVVPALRGPGFAALFPSDPLRAGLLLLLGGALVGFGTRMAGGCTSGHGLNGMSRLQPGSAAATAAFFGAGVAVSLLMAGLL